MRLPPFFVELGTSPWCKNWGERCQSADQISLTTALNSTFIINGVGSISILFWHSGYYGWRGDALQFSANEGWGRFWFSFFSGASIFLFFLHWWQLIEQFQYKGCLVWLLWILNLLFWQLKLDSCVCDFSNVNTKQFLSCICIFLQYYIHYT